MSNFTFKKLSKKAWLEIIDKSLKSVSASEFKWEISKELSGLTFAHQDDLRHLILGLRGSNPDNKWLTGIVVRDIKDLNTVVLEGVEAVKILSPAGVRQCNLLTSSDAENLEWNFRLTNGQELTVLLSDLFSIAKEYAVDLELLKGSLLLEDLSKWDINRIYELLHPALPGVGVCISIPDNGFENNPVGRLSEVFNRLNKWIEVEAVDEKLLSWLFDNLRFEYTLSSNFLLEIATLRALRLVWLNYQKAFGLKQQPAKIMGILEMERFTNDQNNQLILATSSSLSAVIGGVHSLMISSNDKSKENQNQREGQDSDALFRNIQLILKNESSLELVSDPAAGSYAIEDLTDKIAIAVWQNIKRNKSVTP